MRRLIINADDFGLHESINEGIITSYKGGCLTSTTIIAGGRAFDHAVSLAKQYPELGVGIHLTLVGNAPVALGNINTLLTTDRMLLPTYREFAHKYFLGKISKDHIGYELRCQMQKVVGRGIKITHIDSHQHLHTLPGMAEVISDVARAFNINKIRIPSESIHYLGSLPFNVRRFIERALLTGFSSIAKYSYKKCSLEAPRHFFGMLAGGNMSREVLTHIIKTLPEGVSEIMVHPGKDNQVLEQAFRWGYRWQDEMEALESKEILQAIKEQDIQLINYRDF